MIATGSAAPSVQKWIIEKDVEYQLRSGALHRRLQDESLSHGSIELYWKCLNIAAIGWGEQQPFATFPSLLRVDLSGCPKLESIPEGKFAECHHLASVVFGEHSNITILGFAAFGDCSALTSITLPNKLKVIETSSAFTLCSSLERVVCNKNLKTIGNGAFEKCPKLEDVQLVSSSIFFGQYPFIVCDRLIEIAAAVGFPSNKVCFNDAGEQVSGGDGVAPCLIARFERSERKRIVLVANIRFNNAVNAHDGTEEEKIAAAKTTCLHPICSTCGARQVKLKRCSACNLAFFGMRRARPAAGRHTRRSANC